MTSEFSSHSERVRHSNKLLSSGRRCWRESRGTRRRGQDSRGSTSHYDPLTMAARFDKRAMGEPIHSTSADERPSLRSFQEELQQKAKAGRELAHPRRAQDAAGLAEVADKVHELSIDEGDAPDGGDGRTLRVSSPPPE